MNKRILKKYCFLPLFFLLKMFFKRKKALCCDKLPPKKAQERYNEWQIYSVPLLFWISMQKKGRKKYGSTSNVHRDAQATEKKKNKKKTKRCWAFDSKSERSEEIFRNADNVVIQCTVLLFQSRSLIRNHFSSWHYLFYFFWCTNRLYLQYLSKREKKTFTWKYMSMYASG